MVPSIHILIVIMSFKDIYISNGTRLNKLDKEATVKIQLGLVFDGDQFKNKEITINHSDIVTSFICNKDKVDKRTKKIIEETKLALNKYTEEEIILYLSTTENDNDKSHFYRWYRFRCDIVYYCVNSFIVYKQPIPISFYEEMDDIKKRKGEEAENPNSIKRPYVLFVYNKDQDKDNNSEGKDDT